ncbi:hypothetical protein G4O51_04725 [Candidatus Bathyarchaeota archaeon A05DMB-2]|nr:hypothetical protein [Candidatus Bathyarchaeota archaeon A05DMB-2]
MKPVSKLEALHRPQWFKKHKEKGKEKEARQRGQEPQLLRMAAFAITLASMSLGMSLLPVFPQPLPILIAFLIAFVTYKSPKFGMPIGAPLIALGLLYHLSALNFIVALGDTFVRGLVVFMFLFLFTALPLVFHGYRDAIAINLGIIAAILLFSGGTYYLAVPLILTSAVFFKKKAVLSAVFYGLISVPLMVMQYLNYFSQIERPDWWVEPGSSPPIYVPLTHVFEGMQESMAQFRLYDTSKIVWSITGQITDSPPLAEHTVGEALSHYLDSLPGIALFIVMVFGLVLFIGLLARMLFEKTPELPGERLLPMVTAVTATALFFVFLIGLQGALAFRADVNGTQMVIGTFATVLFTAPALLVNTAPKKRATTEMIIAKAQELLGKLQVFEGSLNTVKSNIPVPVSAIEGKMLVVKDRLNDIISKTSTSYYDLSESDEVFDELDKDLTNQLNELTTDLDVAVSEYQIYVNGEYAAWTGKLRGMGLEVKTAAKTDFQIGMPIEDKVNQIKEVLEDGQRVSAESVQVVVQVYSVIRSLYDPSLPEKSQAIEFAQQKLREEPAPWLAMEALFTALNNWRKQYGAEISKSVQYLQDSLTAIASLNAQSERLLPVLGGNYVKVMDDAKKAAEIRIIIEKNSLNVTNVITIKDVFQSSLTIAKDVVSILYSELKSTEEAIQNLLPDKDYLWEKNISLMERLSSAVSLFSDESQYGVNKVLENMPKSLSNLGECVDTLDLYNERLELLLNYPIAAMTIESLSKQKKQVSARDLPFESRFAQEYLKLFYSESYSRFVFDESNLALMRRE